MDMPVMTLQQAQSIYEKPAYVVVTTKNGQAETSQQIIDAQQGRINEAQAARLQAIRDAGLGVGLRNGLAWQLNNIEAVIRKNERVLDTIYDFSPMMIHDRVVPPVISEARDLYNQSGAYSLRLSGAHYRIESQARFSSSPPVWREYLSFAKADSASNRLNSLLAPKNSLEVDLWKTAVTDGWRQGIEQSNLILTSALDRLNRDYQGMLLFHTFVMQGKITLPAIASESIAITKEGSTLSVDETLLRITTLSDFNIKMSDWKAGIKGAANPSPIVLVPVSDQSDRSLMPLKKQD